MATFTALLFFSSGLASSIEDFQVGSIDTQGISTYNYCQASFPSFANYKEFPDPSYQMHQIHVFTRHGDRAPIEHWPNLDIEWDACNDPTEKQFFESSSLRFERVLGKSNLNGFWRGNCQPGQLTSKGYLQLKLLGKEIANIYFNQRLNWTGKSELTDQFIEARSTDVWRTIQSAQAFLIGLDKSLTSMQIKVHPKAIDSLTVSANPAIKKVLQTIHKTKRYRQWEKESTKVSEKISRLFSNDNLNLGLDLIFDSFNTMKCHGFDLPCKNHQDCEKLALDAFLLGEWWLKHDYGSGLVNKLRTQNLMQDLLSNFGKDIKLFLYSGHDTTIAAILGFLEASFRWPAYSSSIIFEIWKKDQEQKIRILVNGNFIQLPFCGKLICSIQDFIDFDKRGWT